MEELRKLPRSENLNGQTKEEFSEWIKGILKESGIEGDPTIPGSKNMPMINTWFQLTRNVTTSTRIGPKDCHAGTSLFQ